jgi:hypothetical protein
MMNLALQSIEFLALGAALGAAYLTALAWNVRLYCAGSTLGALSLHLTRFLGLAAILLALARSGASPFLSSFAGFQLARAFVYFTAFFPLEKVL